MKKKVLSFFLIGLLLAQGCGTIQKEPETLDAELAAEPVGTVLSPTAPTSTETREDAPEGMARSPLTGDWIDETLAKSRPIGVMIENTADSLPHYGIASADVIYEAPVEGNLTRYLALFQDYSDLPKIGSVRSARTYYAAWAKEYDALFIHYGQSLFANPILATMDDMNALEVYLGEGAIQSPALDSIMFFRSEDKESPHNAYTSTTGITRAIEKYSYRTSLADGYGSHFKFLGDDEESGLSDGAAADVVSPGYQNQAVFTYDADTGEYLRSELGGAEKDGSNDSSLTVSNLILQVVDYDYYSGISTSYDAKNYLDLAYLGSGSGTYVADGAAYPITWEKAAENVPTRFYTVDGEELSLKQGKTWICVILQGDVDRVQIEANGN